MRNVIKILIIIFLILPITLCFFALRMFANETGQYFVIEDSVGINQYEDLTLLTYVVLDSSEGRTFQFEHNITPSCEVKKAYTPEDSELRIDSRDQKSFYSEVVFICDQGNDFREISYYIEIFSLPNSNKVVLEFTLKI